MTSDLRPYPEYKDSSLHWLGRIPKHWNEKRAKYFFREVDERSTTGKEQLLSVSHKTGVTPRKSNVTMFKAASNVGHKICRPGDLAINTLWAWMAALGVSRETGLVSPAYGVYRQRDAANYHPDFIDFLLRTQPYTSEYRCRSTGITTSRLRLYPIDFLCIPLVQPPPNEQEAIVSNLRHHHVLVRKFIQNRRRLIEVLNEQKQAIINQAVTRGLDLAAPLKPSGVDWLGDMPSHWHHRRLKFLVHNVNEQTSTKSSEEIYIALEHVESWTGRVTLRNNELTFDSQVKRFRPNDVLFGKLRPYLAKVTRPQVAGVCVGEFLVLRNSEPAILPEFLERKLRSKQLIDLINSSTFGAKMPRADWTYIGNVTIAYPPTHDEQHELLRRTAEQTASLSSAIERAQREIELIREYRTRLIADVVTGKLDVRQHSAHTRPVMQSRPTANVHFRRSVFAAEIVHRLHDEPTFGHVKFEKVLFLCEKRCGVDTGSTYHRQAAGPYDNRALRSIDSQLKKQSWYEARKGDKGYRYQALEKAGRHKAYFARYFGNIAARFDEVIDTFRTLNTQRCEIVATLYAAWADLLAKGEAKDDQIIEQVLHHWHPSKRHINEDRWRRALAWMKSKRLTPENTGVPHAY